MRNAKRRTGFWIFGICATALIVCLCLPYHPAYQEWIYKGASIKQLEAKRAMWDENPVYFYYLGRRLQEAHREEEAIPVLDRGVALDLDDGRLRDRLAQAHITMGHTREAYQVLRQFYETHPNDPEAFLMMARFYLTTQSFDPAAKILGDTVLKFPENPEGWALLAIAQKRLSGTLEAERSVANAVRLRPSDGKYRFLQAQILKQSHKNEAKAAYEATLRIEPENIEVQADFADFLARSAEYEAARKWAQSVLEREPNNTRAKAALGMALAEQNDPKAFALLRAGLQNNPQDVLILRTLHRLSLKQDKLSDAQFWIKRSVTVQAAMQEESDLNTLLEKNPNDKAALRKMAALMGRNGDYFRCMRYWAQILHQVADAPEPLLAAAHDLNAGHFPDLAKRLTEEARRNSVTPQDRAAAEEYLKVLNSP